MQSRTLHSTDIYIVLENFVFAFVTATAQPKIKLMSI